MKTEDDRLSEAAARLAEFFPDYVIAVRTKGGFLYRTSDDAWALGAMLKACVQKLGITGSHGPV